MTPTRLHLEAARQARMRIFRQRRRRRRKTPRMLFPSGIDRQYRRALLDLVEKLRAEVERFVIPILPAMEAEAFAVRPDGVRLDNWISDTGDIVTRLLEAMRGAVDEVDELTPLIASETARWVTREVTKVFVSFDLDVFLRMPWLSDAVAAFRAENLSLIKSLSDETVRKIGDTILRDFRTGRDHRKIARDIRDTLDVSANRAKLIARDQIAKLHGQLHMLTQTEMGIREFVWRTALDDRVRPSHAEKEGLTYSWDSPPEDTGLPGESINCRCIGEPVVDELIRETERVLAGAA